MTDVRTAAPYRDPNLSTAERVEDLLARMTLKEKLAQMGSVWVFQLLEAMEFDDTKADELLRHGLGQVTRVAGASNLDPAGVAHLANTIQKYLVEKTRLGIPAIVHEEATAGYMARGATEFPQNVGLAATWEPELARRIGSQIAAEMRAAGAHQALAPVLDVCRDPRWGRVEETFGEDPYLVSAFGTATIEGLQGGDEPVVATAKHFAGHGAAEGGMNSAPPHYGSREFREVHLLPFEAAVRSANVGSIMHAYHEIDGVPALASEELLVEILRNEWGFSGTVVSDYNGVEELVEAHGIGTSLAEAAATALRAGLDVELPRSAGFAGALVEALECGLVDIEQIDQAVRRHLEDKFDLGLFENPYVAGSGMAGAVQDEDIAGAAAAASVVLVKNDDEALPLDPAMSVAVIGPNANSGRNLLSDYSYPAHIELLQENQTRDEAFLMKIPDEFNQLPVADGVQTILDAVTEKAVGEVSFAHGCDVNSDDRSGFDEAVRIAEEADVAVVVVGGKSGLTDDCTCGEARDRMTLNLPGVQDELVAAVHATGTPVVLVVVGGRPLAVPWAAENVPAILYCWLPGTNGAEAIAATLFGEQSPTGRLPITVPRHVGQVPIYYGHKQSGGASRWKGPYVDGSNEPLWPFGHGLTYSTIEYRSLEVGADIVATDGSVVADVTVANIGSRDVDEVVQLYASVRGVSVTRPVKQLIGFHKLAIAVGEDVTIRFTVPLEILSFYDRALNRAVEPGRLRLMSGPSSADLSVVADVTIEGTRSLADRCTAFFSTAIVR
ncbi:MAG: beta-glucosidase [bacterium]|nr:beta-glucosidase [bacterium]